MAHLRTRIILIGLTILTVLLGGTVGFVLIEHYSFFDAFYFTLTTITTIGYGELKPLSTAGRIFNCFLMFFGTISLLLAVGGMTQTAIELEFKQFFGKRRTKNMIEKLSNHYIVCGFGRVGLGAVGELTRAGVSFVIIDRDEHKVEAAMKAGLLAVLADSNNDDTLLDVGVMRAQGLIATLATDADNLFLVLSAKSLNPKLRVCARIAEETSESKFRRAGADFVFAPYDMTGNRMAKALLKPHVFQFIDFTTKGIGLEVGIEQVEVSLQSEFVGHTLAQLQFRREMGVIVLAIRKSDGTMQFNPPAEAQITAGDYLVVMGEPTNLRKLEHMLDGVRS
ncbi:MAG: potassium channel protein [Acidobacteriaceae bacterium]|nr:potassium channel protein [Acidobacteriaceae bacterium]